MTLNERIVIIERLDRSYQALPNWVKTAVKHSMRAPTCDLDGKPFTTFKSVLESASDYTLTTLLEDFEDNGDLLD